MLARAAAGRLVRDADGAPAEGRAPGTAGTEGRARTLACPQLYVGTVLCALCFLAAVVVSLWTSPPPRDKAELTAAVGDCPRGLGCVARFCMPSWRSTRAPIRRARPTSRFLQMLDLRQSDDAQAAAPTAAAPTAKDARVIPLSAHDGADHGAHADKEARAAAGRLTEAGVTSTTHRTAAATSMAAAHSRQDDLPQGDGRRGDASEAPSARCADVPAAVAAACAPAEAAVASLASPSFASAAIQAHRAARRRQSKFESLNGALSITLVVVMLSLIGAYM